MKVGIKIGVCCFWCFNTLLNAQVPLLLPTADTLETVTVLGFDHYRRNLLTSSVKTIETVRLPMAAPVSLTLAVNSLPGVRMEERSPGSYRFNIRGSSLRSPFGVRNVKMYWNQLPLTDPGGNTYFNQISLQNFKWMQVYKGPAGSLYGAGTGGLVTMESLSGGGADPIVAVDILAGGFGLRQASILSGFKGQKSHHQLSYQYRQASGYRQQSASKHHNAHWSSQFNPNEKLQWGFHALFSDLWYQTPGALTFAEFEADPSKARPAAGILPGAVAAKAAIQQTNLLSGLTGRYNFNAYWKLNLMAYGAYASIDNPAIRNYETRREPHTGGRVDIAYERLVKAGKFTWTSGWEGQQGWFKTRVSTNVNGEAGILQTNDEINQRTGFFFTQIDAHLKQDWYLTAGLSLNNNRVTITRINENPVVALKRRYANEWAPRISVLKKIGEGWSLSALFSKGFSPPTTAELLPSTGVISTFLNAETGLNWESSLKWKSRNNWLNADLTAFHFTLKNALVQRRDLSGADYFVNAGTTRQKGLESSLRLTLPIQHSKIIRLFTAQLAYTFNHFRYQNLKKDTSDFTGRQLPGIPPHILSAETGFYFSGGINWQVSALYNSPYYLTDANRERVTQSTILNSRLAWQKKWARIETEIYAGAINLLNMRYSLGNDINDPRGRFYNAAAPRQFFMGVRISLPSAK